MRERYRIHGDNIVECERIANIIVSETNPKKTTTYLLSPSTIVIDLDFEVGQNRRSWRLELLPGFNKAGRSRWEGNIFAALKEHGSFLDETPDAIVTRINGDMEIILFAIEFCSALQAGNQAWQRSGRGFSTGRTGCPYLYIVDFVKYELDSSTRARKALRFPNAAVPYSYINFSKDTSNFVAQVYVRSEEFDKALDRQLAGFDENDFGDTELARYMVKKMCRLDTAPEEAALLQKNLNVVMFLSKNVDASTNFTSLQWKSLYSHKEGILDFSRRNTKFNFHKIITAKGHHGKSPRVLELIDKYSRGLASRDLPIGIIPAPLRRNFAAGLQQLYPSYDRKVIASIADGQKDLILCLIKGFKPRGDDNRPDRGLLPLAVMLSSTDAEIMTYLYGPVLERNLILLQAQPKRLAAANGLWKSILALSNYVALDVPILAKPARDAELLIDTTTLKYEYTAISSHNGELSKPVFSSIPRSYHEDDVDTGIHFLFTHVLHNRCFEGMCNPPGGDWSGFSIIHGNSEKRWLSLPRVSNDVGGKRPDHIIELFDVFPKPLLLSIESKERSMDLEPDVGSRLVNYLKKLMEYVPSAVRTVYPSPSSWKRATAHVDFNDFETISAAAYLKSTAQSNSEVFQNSKCELLFVMEPMQKGWKIYIAANTKRATIVKAHLVNAVNESGSDSIVIC